MPEPRRADDVRRRPGAGSAGDPGPLVSVGLPVHDGARHVAGAIESALAQTHRNLELVISDNASGDATPRICAAYAERDPRVAYERHAENRGMLWNFRRVLERARGRYFTWLAHDDLCDPEYLATLVAFLEAHPDVALCGCSVRIIDADGVPVTEARLAGLYPEVPWRQARRLFFAAPLLDDWDASWWMTYYGVYRREVARRMVLRERRRRGEPRLLWFEFAALASVAVQGRIVALPPVLRAWRWHPASTGYREYTRFDARTRAREAARARLGLLPLVLRARLPRRDKLALAGVAVRGAIAGWWGTPT
jgi:glycosyltransferase involved in cell wall biosynthesis